MEAVRQRSPRAPSMALDEAVQKALAMYEKEGLHPIPTDVAANHLGYKDSSSGPARQAIASLRGYGLLAYVSQGKVAVSRDVQTFKFAPDDATKMQLLIGWLRQPQAIADILDKYSDHLPSEKTLLFDLIQLGFSEKTAQELLNDLLKSVEYTKYYDRRPESSPRQEIPPTKTTGDAQKFGSQSIGSTQTNTEVSGDRIPIRLAGGRRAWIEIPVPFFEKDKDLIKKHIDLITIDEDEPQADNDQ